MERGAVDSCGKDCQIPFPCEKMGDQKPAIQAKVTANSKILRYRLFPFPLEEEEGEGRGGRGRGKWGLDKPPPFLTLFVPLSPSNPSPLPLPLPSSPSPHLPPSPFHFLPPTLPRANKDPLPKNTQEWRKSSPLSLQIRPQRHASTLRNRPDGSAFLEDSGE